MLTTFLLIAACLCFLGAALNVAAPRVQLGWLGAFLWTLSILLGSRGL